MLFRKFVSIIIALLLSVTLFGGLATLEVRAQQSDPNASMDALRKKFGGRGGGEENDSNNRYGRTLLAMFLGTILVVGGGSLLFHNFFENRKKDGFESPWALFRQLAKAHNMSWSEQRFMYRLGKEIGLSNPLEIFVEPKHLTWGLYNVKFADKAKMIHSLEMRFFGEETKLDDEAKGFITSWLSGGMPGLETMVAKAERANTETAAEEDYEDADRTEIWQPREQKQKKDDRDPDDHDGHVGNPGLGHENRPTGNRPVENRGGRNIPLKAVIPAELATNLLATTQAVQQPPNEFLAQLSRQPQPVIPQPPKTQPQPVREQPQEQIVRPQPIESPKSPPRLPIFRREDAVKLRPENIVDFGRELNILERLLFDGTEEKRQSKSKNDRDSNEEYTEEQLRRKLESAMSNTPARPLFIG